MSACLAANMNTGRIIADLPSCDLAYPARHTLSTYDTANAVLNLTGKQPSWETATLPLSTWLAFYDDTTRAIQWCGYVSGRVRNGANQVQLSLVTAEGYLDRRDSDDRTWDATMARDDIVAEAMTLFVVNGAEPGIPLQLAYTAGNGKKPTEPIVWQNTDNASLLTRMQQLFAQLGGEWTIDWALSTDGLYLVPTMRFGDRAGTVVQPGRSPAVTFETPMLTDIQVTEDYSSGKFANKLIPYSSGQGTSTPFAAPVLAPDFQGRPTFEYRYQPAPSISPTALTQYAQQALPILSQGAQSVSLVVSTADTRGRRFGVDWKLGDDIGYNIDPTLPFPSGRSGVGECIAVELTSDSTLTPYLAEAAVYVQAS